MNGVVLREKAPKPAVHYTKMNDELMNIVEYLSAKESEGEYWTYI